MSNLELDPGESRCGGTVGVATEPVRELLAGVSVALGGTRGMAVTRTLPNRDRRMVGAWCFVDHYGPHEVTAGTGMRVPPHPHTSLQTVSWLVDGEVLHRDSLGNTQLIRPGQLNLMTAGRGIAHAEQTPAEHSPTLHGLQLWAALPARDRHVDPDFEHHPELPLVQGKDIGHSVDAEVSVIVGSLGEVSSPATTYTPLVAAAMVMGPGAALRLPVDPDFEYAALTLSGTVVVAEVPLPPGPMLYLGTGRSHLEIRSEPSGQVLLLGGEPFAEQIVMWWNFVGTDHEEIVAAREDWMTGTRFGTVLGYDGDPLPAPPLPTTRLKPRGRHRSVTI